MDSQMSLSAVEMATCTKGIGQASRSPLNVLRAFVIICYNVALAEEVELLCGKRERAGDPHFPFAAAAQALGGAFCHSSR
jgi:hypothetical protein